MSGRLLPAGGQDRVGGQRVEEDAVGQVRAAELILLGQPFGASRAAELGLVTQVVPDQQLLAIATETARRLAEKPAAAVQACKRLLKQAFRQQLEQAVKLENEEFAVRVRSDEATEVFKAFFAKRQTASQHA